MANQYSYSVREALLAGVRQTKYAMTDTQTLEACTGLTPSKDGLVRDALSVIPFTESENTQTHMQFMDGEELVVLNFNSSDQAMLYLVDRETWAQGSNQFTAGAGINMSTGTGSVSPAKSYAKVQWVGHLGNVVFSNGEFLATNYSLYPSLAVAKSADGWIPQALGQYNTRLVVGNLSTTKTILDSSAWATSWELLKKYSYDYELVQSVDVIDESMFILGMPGGGAMDIPYSLEMCLLTEYRASEFMQILHNAIRDRQILLCRVPWGGKILGFTEMMGKMLIYTSRGVGAFELTAQGPVYTLLVGAPVASRAAFDGSFASACFVDKSGSAWLASGSLEFTEYDFSEFLLPRISAAKFKVRYDDRLGDFYFLQDGAVAYKLSRLGKFSTDGCLAGDIFYDADKTYTNASSQPADIVVEIRLSDRRRRMLKQAQHVQLFYSGITDLTAKLKYRYKHTDSFKTSAALSPNKEGVVYLGRQYLEANLVLSGTATVDSALWDAIVHYQETDKRYDRGIGVEAQGQEAQQ